MAVLTNDTLIVAYYDDAADASRMEAWQARLQPFLPAIQLVPIYSDLAQEAMAITAWKPPLGRIAQLPNLKGIISLGQGVDHIFRDETIPDALPLVRLVDPDMSVALGHWVCLAVLEKCRKASDYRALAKRREFRPLPQTNARDLKIGVYGVGAIGYEVARQLSALHFDVHGYVTTQREDDAHLSYHWGPDGLNTMITDMDMHICLMPLTDDTRGFFHKDVFQAMKVGAYFINAGRGGHVVEDDLLQALNQGHLSGASLDVFDVEPLPDDHGFWDHPHITIWPHVAAQTNPQTAAEQVANALLAFHENREAANQVDKKRGY